MDLSELRGEIDAIDDQLVDLFCRRMEISAKVAQYKKENNLPVFIPSRELEILEKVSGKADPEFSGYMRTLYSLLFELSRDYQNKQNETPGEVI